MRRKRTKKTDSETKKNVCFLCEYLNRRSAHPNYFLCFRIFVANFYLIQVAKKTETKNSIESIRNLSMRIIYLNSNYQFTVHQKTSQLNVRWHKKLHIWTLDHIGTIYPTSMSARCGQCIVQYIVHTSKTVNRNCDCIK